MGALAHRNFLKLLDFRGEELESFLPRWEAAAEKIGLTEKDVDFAVQEWIPAYWDTSLRGVRLCMAAYIRELVEMCSLDQWKKAGSKVVYGIMPSQPVCYRAIKFAGGDKVKISYPDFLMASVLNSFFNRADPLMEDTTVMTPRCRHCGLNKLRLNARRQDRIVSPDVVWNWGLYCSEGPKTEELIQCLEDPKWSYITTMVPHDQAYGSHEADNEERVQYLAAQLEYAQKKIGEITGVPVEKEHMCQAIEEYHSYIVRLDYLNHLVGNADPQPITGNEITLFGAPTGMAFDTGFRYLREALETMIREVEARIAAGIGVLPKGAPKLGCHFIPFCLPWVDKAFLDQGVSLSFSTCFAFSKEQLNFIDCKNPYYTVAKHWYQGANAVNMKDEANIISEILKEYRLNGMLYGFYTFDRWLGAHQKTMIQMVEKQTGIQHFYIEGDFWDDENYRIEDRIRQIENISYFLHMEKMISI